MLDSTLLLIDTDFPTIYRGQLHTLQVNLGYLCNLSCTHCHVNAGPKRTELMDRETVDLLLEYIDARNIKDLDLTGGAPEMNPHFRYLVIESRRRGVRVVDRCNLTILLEPGYEDLAGFLAEQGVQIVASLPCYAEQNVQEQRGKGVYQSSIEALQRLNKLGYGTDPALGLDLVYNPNGAFLPPPQQGLQHDYETHLLQQHSIRFNQLLTITNMPISRFGSMLQSKDIFSDYLQLLKDNYVEDNLAAVMCRHLISIDWQGFVYDCDFNQMLGWAIMPMSNQSSAELVATDKHKIHLNDLLQDKFENHQVRVGEHCYGCTAGQGSSCGGALS